MTTVLRTLSILGSLALVGWGLAISEDINDARWLVLLFGAWILLIIGTRIDLPLTMPTFNRILIRTALVLTTVFIVISAQLVRIQVVEQDAIYYRTGVDDTGEVISNPRLVNQQLDFERGRIFDRNGVVIADTVQQDGLWYRTWPVASAYPVIGYYSPLMYGSTGLEATFEQELSGQAGNNSIERTVRDMLGMPQEGSNLNLTLDTALQNSALNMLGDSQGAVVVLDVQTGATLVLASNPTYDPNRLFTTGNDPEAAAYWDALLDDPETPLVVRANQGVYTPGSTFKTVTAAIAIEEGFAEPDSVYEDNGQLNIEGRILPEFNRPDESRDQWTLAEGVAWSLNVVFAQIGMQIGGETYWEYGPRLGFGETIPYDLPVAESQIANNRDALSDTNMVADTGFGQGQLLMSPLHLAMTASAWANDGRMMEPYLVSSVTDADGSVTWSADPSVWREPVSSETANQVEAMMVNAVENGSITNAYVDGYLIGGKTGTAEIGNDTSHSLFIGFIGDPEPRYAVAVVLEEGSGGLTSAVAIGRDILVGAIQRYPDVSAWEPLEAAYVRSQIPASSLGKTPAIW
jgi:peptidoglycan glycosyltransferase